jgi:hypothetical protein
MKSRKSNLLIIESCGSEVLDKVLATVNYEIEGDGAILTHTDDLRGIIPEIEDQIKLTSKGYEGLVLLRK